MCPCLSICSSSPYYSQRSMPRLGWLHPSCQNCFRCTAQTLNVWGSLADALALSAATTSSPTRFRFEYGWVRGLGVARIHFGLSDDRADHPGQTKIDAKLEATAIVRRSAPRPQCARSRFRARLQRSPNRRTVSRYWWCDQVGCPTDSPAPSCNMDFGAGPLGDLGVIQGGSDRRAIDALRFVRRLITVNVRCALQSDCRRLWQRFVAGPPQAYILHKGLERYVRQCVGVPRIADVAEMRSAAWTIAPPRRSDCASLLSRCYRLVGG
jgi:hypothetical protein